MTTKEQLIAQFKAENPTLKTGSEEDGYTNLSVEEYEATIDGWADARLEKEAKLAEAEAVAQAKVEAMDKLTALGIDPKALGLQHNPPRLCPALLTGQGQSQDKPRAALRSSRLSPTLANFSAMVGSFGAGGL